VKEADQFSRKSCSVGYSKQFKSFVNPVTLTVKYSKITYVFVFGYKDADRLAAVQRQHISVEHTPSISEGFSFIPPREPKISEFYAFI